MNLRSSILHLLLCAFLCLPFATAQTDPSASDAIGFDQVLAAVAEAPAVRSAAVRLEMARLDLEALQSPVRASVGASADQTWTFGDAAGSGTGGGTSASVNASASFDVLSYGPSEDARTRAEHAVARARLQLDDAASDTLITALKQFAQALRADQEVGIAEAELALAQDELAAVREQREAGAANDAQVLQAELAVASAGNDVAAAERAALDARGDLAQTLGIAVDAVTGTIPDPELPSDLDVTDRILVRSDVIEAELAVADAYLALAAAHRDATPTAAFDMAYSGSSGGTRAQVGAGFDTSSYQPSASASVGVSSAGGTDTGQLSLSVAVTIPLDASHGAEIATSELQVEHAEANLSRAIDLASADVEGLQRSLAGAEAQVELAEQILEQARLSRDDTQKRADLGLISALEVREAEIDVREAELHLERARDASRNQALALAAALGFDPAEVLP